MPPKKGVDWRERIYRVLNGLPLRGRPGGRQTGAEPGKRSIPKAWRDLDYQCLEFALKELNDESWGDEQFVRFVNCAARKARSHEKKGDYKIRRLSDKPTERKLTGLRQSRTHEQRVRRRAKAFVLDARRDLLEL
jgi:hypothetical protein